MPPSGMVELALLRGGCGLAFLRFRRESRVLSVDRRNPAIYFVESRAVEAYNARAGGPDWEF
jgi:hypothetical protein